MHPLMIVGIVIAIFLLISLIPVGCKASYLLEQLQVRVRIGRIWLTVYPPKPKKSKAKKVKPEGKKKESKKFPLPENKLEMVQEILSIIADGAEGLRRRLCIDLLELDFIMGGSDPANVAIGYGVVNGVLGGMIALLERGFDIKQRQIRTGLDFNRASPLVEGTLALSLTIGQGVSLVVRIGGRLLSLLAKWKKESKTDIKS